MTCAAAVAPVIIRIRPMKIDVGRVWFIAGLQDLRDGNFSMRETGA
jgi:hypothetical protein